MRKVNLLVLAVVAIYLLAAPLALGQGGKGGNVEQTIKALTEQWRQALLKGDAAAYDKLTADDFITIGTAGRSFTKAEIVELLQIRQVEIRRLRLLRHKSPGLRRHCSGQLHVEPKGAYRRQRAYRRPVPSRPRLGQAQGPVADSFVARHATVAAAIKIAARAAE
jgi:Domain of unknown function (DUF4440)